MNTGYQAIGRVTESIVVRIGVVGPGRIADRRIQRITIIRVTGAVVIVVVVTYIPYSVTIRVRLFGIEDGRTVIVSVVDTIAVPVSTIIGKGGDG